MNNDLATIPAIQTHYDLSSGYLFTFGAYGSTHLAVLADSLESALEEALEWLDDNAPGLLSTVTAEDYANAARELGVAWQPEEQADADTDRVVQHAEQDMTMVSHTTLKNGNCIPSWEWTARELDASEVEIVRSRLETDDE